MCIIYLFNKARLVSGEREGCVVFASAVTLTIGGSWAVVIRLLFAGDRGDETLGLVQEKLPFGHITVKRLGALEMPLFLVVDDRTFVLVRVLVIVFIEGEAYLAGAWLETG